MDSTVFADSTVFMDSTVLADSIVSAKSSVLADSAIINLIEVWTEVGYVFSGWLEFSFCLVVSLLSGLCYFA